MNTCENFKYPYSVDPKYAKSIAYFSMEFAGHQPLKTYAGELGYWACPHTRSAFQLNQNVIGILWKYGYFNQTRKTDQMMGLNRITVRVSIVGTRKDLQEAIDFAVEGKVKTVVKTAKLEDINTIFDEMKKSQINGRVVLEIGKI